MKNHTPTQWQAVARRKSDILNFRIPVHPGRDRIGFRGLIVKYTRLGRTGVHISNVTLGGSFFGTRISETDSRRILERSLELGINAVDTAESYLQPVPQASETVLGRILKGRRHDVFLSSKVGPSRSWETSRVNLGLTRRVVNQAVEGSLKRLRTDHIDLLFAHFPDPATPLDETLASIDDLIRAGKVRYAGLSNHSASNVTEALWIADRLNLRPIVATQDLYNLFERVNEHDLYPTCLKHDIAAYAYAPLAGGLLSGKYSLDMVRDLTKIPAEARAGYYGKFTDDSAPTRSSPKLTERSLTAVERIKSWAETRGHTTTNLALAWVMGHPAVTSLLLGVTTIEQLEENVPAFDLEVSEADRAEIAELVPRESLNVVRPMW